VTTPITPRAEIARVVRASFNHCFTSHRVGRARINPGIWRMCVCYVQLVSEKDIPHNI
jgi:hypothetical protein